MFNKIDCYDFDLGTDPDLTFEMRFARENANDKGEKFNVRTAAFII